MIKKHILYVVTMDVAFMLMYLIDFIQKYLKAGVLNVLEEVEFNTLTIKYKFMDIPKDLDSLIIVYPAKF